MPTGPLPRTPALFAVLLLAACGGSTTEPDPANTAPQVTITSPASGASAVAGSSTSFLATATDAEDGNLATSIGWASSLDGSLGTGGMVTPTLSEGTHTIVATVQDSDGASAADTISFTVDPNSPPALTITSPGADTTVVLGSSVALSGEAADPESGDLAGLIQWSSSIDGDLGTGATVVADLSPGTHTVTADVEDPQGMSATATVSVFVHHRPTVGIVTPSADTTVTAGDAVTLVGEATDAEDGDLSASLVWTSSIDGGLGSGATITPTLSAGVHEISADVEDSHGASAAPYTLTVVVNEPPVLVIGTPAADTTITEGALLGLTASAIDSEDGDITISIVWTSSRDGLLGTGTGLAVELTPGTHVVTATVEDSEGATAADSVTVSVDVQVPPSSVTIASLRSHTCALDSGGAVYCWGDNAEGQVGDGTQTEASSPIAVVGGLTFEMISTGDYFTCGLTTEGAAYCWGQNYNLELGNGTAQSSVPLPVSGGMTFVTLSTGASHTCALTDAGEAYCWGYNGNGELGNGSWGSDENNSSVPTLVLGGHRFVEIAAAASTTCAIAAHGPVYCWGSNTGYFGTDDQDGVTEEPLLVTGDFDFVKLAGGGHMCGLTSAGAAYCWGLLVEGDLVTSPAPVPGGLAFDDVAVGYAHTCGITSTGAAYCWGENGLGELGTGTMELQATNPQPVAGGLTFEAIAPGWRHTCGLTTTGDAYCWGDASAGALGDGGTTSPRTYEPVPTDPF